METDFGRIETDFGRIETNFVRAADARRMRTRSLRTADADADPRSSRTSTNTHRSLYLTQPSLITALISSPTMKSRMFQQRKEARNRFSNILTPDDDDECGSDAFKSDHSKYSSSQSTTSSTFSETALKYRRLRNVYADSGFSDSQFQKVPTKIPWKAIALATFLFLGGTVALTMAILSLSGHIDGEPTDGPVVLLALGLLMFVPGFYHVRIAYYAFQEYDGYSFDDIPSFD